MADERNYDTEAVKTHLHCGRPGCAFCGPKLENERDPAQEAETLDLVEELGVTAIIDALMDSYIANVTLWLNELTDTSEDGNPVRTHVAIITTSEDIINDALFLRDRLVELLAKNGEEFEKQGGALTSPKLPLQVVDESADILRNFTIDDRATDEEN